MLNLFVELEHFLSGKFDHLSARSATPVSHGKNRCELPQRKTHGKRVLNQQYSIQSVVRIHAISVTRARRPLQNPEALVVPERIGTYPGRMGKIPRSKTVIQVSKCHHFAIMCPGIDSRVKRIISRHKPVIH